MTVWSTTEIPVLQWTEARSEWLSDRQRFGAVQTLLPSFTWKRRLSYIVELLRSHTCNDVLGKTNDIRPRRQQIKIWKRSSIRPNLESPDPWYIKHEWRCFIGISKHREDSWKIRGAAKYFDAIRGVWISDETLSRVFDISSQSKQKLRSKRRSKIVKIYAN